MDTVIAVIVVGISIVGVLLLVPLGGDDKRATRPRLPSRPARARRARVPARGRPAGGRHRRGRAPAPGEVAGRARPSVAAPGEVRAPVGTLTDVRTRDRVRSALTLVGLLVVLGAIVGGLIALGAIVVDDALRDAADAATV